MKKRSRKEKKSHNLIATLSFLIALGIFLYSLKGNIELNSIIRNIDEKQTENEEDVIDNDLLDSFYTEANINLKNILFADDNITKSKLVDLLNNFRQRGSKEIIGDERREMVKYYDDTMIMGDSQVAYIKHTSALETEHIAPMPGHSITEQLDIIDDHLRKGIKNIVLWNGYNIFEYKDPNEFIDAYEKLIAKIHAFDKNIKVYVCSLLPARSDVVRNDLQSDVRHDIYKGPEYDHALREHFGKNNTYINLNFLVRDDFYADDGVHFGPQFHFMLVPYIAYYTHLTYENVDNINLAESEEWKVSTGSTVSIGNFYNLKRNELVEEPLRFKVMENDGKSITCISYEVVDNVPYAKDEDAEYNDSYLRKYLTGYFYNSCFTDEEKQILKPVYKDKDINDYITVLSSAEYRKYVDNGFRFSTDNSKYSYEKVDRISNSYVSLVGNVWLRDSYYVGYHQSNEYAVMHLRYPYDRFMYGVRPVIKMDIKSYLSYANKEQKNIKEKMDYESFYLEYFGEEDISTDAMKMLKNNEKTIYLTFDDGPSYLTSQVLDILDQYEVKATFFLCDYANKDKDVITRMITQGHSVGIHCFSHHYEELYTSIDVFLDNFEKLREKLKKDFKLDPKIMRFPGGSSNALSVDYNKGIMTKLIKIMHEKGYEFYDWNISSGDANPQKASEDIVTDVLKTANPYRESVILMHDSMEHMHTVEALPSIIEYYKANGYKFKAINEYTLPVYKHAVN